MTIKRLPYALLITLVSLAVAGAALAAPALQAFGDGEVMIDGDGARIVNDAGEYGGVYLPSKSLSGKPLAAVELEFTSTGDVAGGSPRFSVPLDTDGVGGTAESYAFIDAQRCGGTSGSSIWVSTENPDCIIDVNTGGSYANWDAFAAANPTWRVAPGFHTFIIADQAGTYVVTDIALR